MAKHRKPSPDDTYVDYVEVYGEGGMLLRIPVRKVLRPGDYLSLQVHDKLGT